MLPSEKLAIAAHLHVLLRRKTGRVTDTEWMASNQEYATEVVRFARRSAESDGHADLKDWADKLELAMVPGAIARPVSHKVAAAAAAAGSAILVAQAVHPGTGDAGLDMVRYVRGLR